MAEVMRWTAWIVLMAPLGVGCGGGGGSTTDTGGEAADVPGDAAPDGGPDAVDGEVGDVEVGGEAEADGEGGAGDVPGDEGADLPEASKRSALTPTSGGGTARGGSYALTLTIGTPQPMGRGSSVGYRGTLGPAAVLGQ